MCLYTVIEFELHANNNIKKTILIIKKTKLDLSEGERMHYLDQKLADVTTFVPMAQFLAQELIAMLKKLPCQTC